MDFKSRSFIGNQASLPKPEVFFDPSERFLVVASTWGNPAGGKKLVKTISEYFLATKSDKEATSPFRRLEYLSPVANNLRIATLVANEVLYREENRSEYRCGVELFVGSIQDRELAFVQVGHPHVIFSRRNQPIMPLSVRLSLAAEASVGNEKLPPLPSSLIGISPEPNLYIQSISPRPGDALILLSRSWIPGELFNVHPDQRTFDQFSKSLALDGDEPFWMGLWSL